MEDGMTRRAIPAANQMFQLPPKGVASLADAAALPGAKRVDKYICPGQSEGNLYRVPLP